MPYGHVICGMWGVQWDVTIQPAKTRPKLHCRNKSYVRHRLVAYFPSLAKERGKKTVGQNITDMVYIPPNWKTKTVSESV